MYFFSFRFIPSYTINKLSQEREGGNVPIPVFGPSKHPASGKEVGGGKSAIHCETWVCQWRTSFGEDVAKLRFELGVESSAAETELVLVVLRMLNSSEAATDSGGSNGRHKRNRIRGTVIIISTMFAYFSCALLPLKLMWTNLIGYTS